MVITSIENNKIKSLKKLHRKKYRDITNSYLVEGEHLVLEAYKSHCLLEVYLLESKELSLDISYTYVNGNVMKYLTTTDTPCSMIGVCRKNINSEIVGSRILLLDEIQDPGNLGTIIRSAVAFNIDTIVLSENTVDLYNSKVLRSAQGMNFYINIISMNSVECIELLKTRGYTIYGTNVNGGVDARRIDKNNKFCLVIGNEGNGVRSNILELCDKNLYIKMNNNVESLNVGVACSIILYELGR